ncbi:alpha-L-fucosidase [Stakelama sp. CBK3Z-3]|uniref:Alpha-L-fucosidase n=1 Tax=Stakelama flava TaxID=2860338 RepID=A0ABS6XNI0_9SPHN|nr:alpha-L-fucosidase [Stakelama flava]MBW4331764.1 alpha-L-fucosidase [Stakelama flava]
MKLKAVLLAALAGSVAMPAMAQDSEVKFPMDFQKAPVEHQLDQVAKGIKDGPYKAEWGSLKAFQVPEWFRDAKFGIFIHWGVYSVPGFASEWYSRNMYEPHNAAFTYHRNVYGPQSKFGYKDFIPEFTADKFDAARWIRLFQDAGAKYVIPVAEHCDGFAMYDSDMTHWDVTEMGPKRDTAGELMTAARKAGMHFGLSSHRAEHWWWYGVGRGYDSDVNDPRYAGLYGPAAPRALPADPKGSVPDPSHLENWFPPNQQFLDDWLARTTEIVDKYKPEMIYLDWWTSAPAFEPDMQKFAAYYYNSGRKYGYAPAIAYKGEQFESGTALFDIERGKLDALRLEPWQTDTSVSVHSWGYAQDDEYRTAKSLTQDLVDVVAKNGNLLLNIGPKADGTIPQQAQDVLLGMGKWLKVNGEAIYGSRPWKYFGEGPTTSETGQKSENPNKSWTPSDIRFTTKGDTLYAIGMERPADGTALIKTMYAGSPYLTKPIASIEVLGYGAAKWQQDDTGLKVMLPDGAGTDMPYTLRIRFKG